jgi:transcriptional regulator with XRE-family HTH domain
MTDLYKRIEDLCASRGISITKMCAESGASRGALGDLAGGKTQTLSIKTLEKIARYFSVSVDYLLGKEKTAPEKSEAVSESDMKLIEWFRSLPPEKQRAILTAQDAPEGIV